MFSGQRLKYVLVMVFAAVALLVSMLATGGTEPILIAIWLFVIATFGIYLYWTMFRSGPKE